MTLHGHTWQSVSKSSRQGFARSNLSISQPHHDFTGLIMIINCTKPVDRRTHTHARALINVGRGPTGPYGPRLGQQGPPVVVESHRPPMTNVGTKTAFRHATIASISKNVSISRGQRSVDWHRLAHTPKEAFSEVRAHARTTQVDFEVDRPPPADSPPGDLLITMVKEAVI